MIRSRVLVVILPLLLLCEACGGGTESADAIVSYEIIDGTAMGIAVRYLNHPTSQR